MKVYLIKDAENLKGLNIECSPYEGLILRDALEKYKMFFTHPHDAKSVEKMIKDFEDKKEQNNEREIKTMSVLRKDSKSICF